jgi:hypothetical protein
VTPNASVRALGLLSIPTTVLLAFLTPVQATAYDAEGVKPWMRDLDTVHSYADRVWSAFGASWDRYEFWGRWTVLCYLGMIVGVWAFARTSAAHARGSRLLMGALCVATIGDIGAYWGDAWNVVTYIFGTIEFLALPVVIAGAIRYGYVLVRRGPRPRWAGWLLLASAAAVPVSLSLTNYWPHGALLPISVGIAALSVRASRSTGSESPTDA